MIKTERQGLVFDRHFYFGPVTSPLSDKQHGRHASEALLELFASLINCKNPYFVQ